MGDCQLLTGLDIKIKLLRKGINQKELIPILQKKHPHLKIQEAHISMALRDKYPPMLDKIREIVTEIKLLPT